MYNLGTSRPLPEPWFPTWKRKQRGMVLPMFLCDPEMLQAFASKAGGSQALRQSLPAAPL